MKNTISIAFIIFAICAASGCKKELGVTGISPPVGMMRGGEPVKIIGSGFSPDMGITIYFGNTKADNVVVRGTDVITVTTPSTSKDGSVDIRILMDSGQEFVLRRAFKYLEKTSMDIRDIGERRSMRKKQ